jgi:hypothetical protein
MSTDRSQTWQAGFSRIPSPPPRSAAHVSNAEPAPDAGPGHETQNGAAAAEGSTTARSVLNNSRDEANGARTALLERPESELPAASGSPSQTVTPARQPLRSLPLPSRSAAAPVRAVTAAQVRAGRAAAGYAATVTACLAEAGVPVRAVEADVAGERLHLVLEPDTGSVDEVLAHADVIADGLGVQDASCSTDGTRVHVWAATGASGGTRQVAAWVPLAVREAVNAIREAQGQPVTTIVLSAFNRVAGEDGSGLDELFGHVPAVMPGPMAIAPRKARKKVDTPVQLWLFLHPSQVATLDQAVARTGAGSRSALLTRILEVDLGLPVTAD